MVRDLEQYSAWRQGVVVALQQYQAWLQGGGESGTLAQRGARLFDSLACNSCHLESGQGRGPSLKDIVGKTVTLQDESTVVVDDAYLRESILTSQAKQVKGFQPLMPTFQGLISEEGLVSLIEHLQSMSPNAGAARGTGAERSPDAEGATGATPPPGAARPQGSRQ